MDDYGERLARIEEGMKFLIQAWERFEKDHRGHMRITQQNSTDIALNKNDKRWLYTIALALSSAILSLVGYLKK